MKTQEITGIFTHSGTYKIAILQWTDFREGPVSRYSFVFSFGSNRDVYCYLFIYFYILKHGSPVSPFQKNCFSGESRIQPWPNN